MIRIGPLDLEEKAAVVAVILENPFKPQKRQPKWEPMSWKSGWICSESEIWR